MEIRVVKGDYQDRFLLSEKKFPACKAGIGTGKTMLALIKVHRYCEKYPGTTALIVRKEFSDLQDSTMKDFQEYFETKIPSNKNYVLSCGSKIMFRHASEIAVLKNVNLGIAMIEQAEEFEDDTQFQFIRDRLRQKNGANVRPLIVIANANGHNWVYNIWMKGAHREEIDAETGQYHYARDEDYDLFTATTFANEKNLPDDFIKDCRKKETEAPNHFKQYSLNDDEITEEDDFVFTFQELEEARKREYAIREGYGMKLTGYDIARYGNDKSAAVCLQQMGALIWKVRYVDQWEKKDLAYTTGRIISTTSELQSDGQIIDEEGYGAGPLDFINEGKMEEDKYKGFRNVAYNKIENKDYGNARTRYAFDLKDLMLKGHISLTYEDLCQELLTLRFKYTSDGRKILIPKEVMRSRGIASPNVADGLIMAISLIGAVKQKQDRQYDQHQPQYSKEESLFNLAGVR